MKWYGQGGKREGEGKNTEDIKDKSRSIWGGGKPRKSRMGLEKGGEKWGE